MRKSAHEWVWLIETQLKEIRDLTDNIRGKEYNHIKIANEFADIIGIAVQAISDLGFNPVTVLEERRLNVAARIDKVVEKYDRMWKLRSER